jgi:hypothetical protein
MIPLQRGEISEWWRRATREPRGIRSVRHLPEGRQIAAGVEREVVDHKVG